MELFAVYVLFVALALAVIGVAAALAPTAKRPCPNCSRGVALSARLCRRCGYGFG